MTGRFIEMGLIVAPHGIRGEVKISPNCLVSDFATYAPFYDENGQKVDVSIKRKSKNQIIATINDVRDRNNAELLRGMKLFVSRQNLPTLNKNEYYVCDLIGMDVFQNEMFIGQVTDVQNYGASDILSVKKTDKGELLLAMCPQTILDVNLDQRKIMVNIPTEIEAKDEN